MDYKGSKWILIDLNELAEWILRFLHRAWDQRFLWSCSFLFSIDTSILISIGLLCSQGNTYEIPKLSAKIVLLVILVCSLVLNASYSANLTSLLYAKKLVLPFRDQESLFYESKYDIGTVRDTTYYTAFEVSIYVGTT